MAESVTNKQLKQLRSDFSNDPAAKVAQNAVTNGNLLDIALNRDLVQNIDSTFSIKLDDWKVTNQKSSGRCWLFATLNLFRPGTMKKLNVKDFWNIIRGTSIANSGFFINIEKQKYKIVSKIIKVK